MARKIISEGALTRTIELIDLHTQQLETAEKLVKAVKARRNTLMEFVRANFTGDDKAFNILKQGFIDSEGRGSTALYYDCHGLISEALNTKRIVEVARKWTIDKQEKDDLEEANRGQGQ